MASKRSRNATGKIRKKNSNTLAETVEKKYGVELGVRDDKKLKNILKDEGVPSLSKLLKKKR